MISKWKITDCISQYKTIEREIKNILFNRADIAFFFIVMIAFLTASIFFLGISAYSAISFALCTILFVVLQGFAVQILVGKAYENILLGFAIGYAINIVEYIIIWGLKMQNYAFALTVLFTFSLIFLAVRKLKRIEVDDGFKSDRSGCGARVSIIDFAVIFSVCLIISYVLYSCRYVSPIVTGRRNDIGRDLQYWCSNAVALKLHFPPVASYFEGARLFHHYFSCIHVAFFSQISGIDVFDLAFPLYSFERAALFSGAVLYLVKNQKKWIRWVVYGLFCITTGYESLSYVTYLSHTITSPFGCDIGFFFGIYFVGFLIEQAECKQFKIELYIPITLFWLMCVGSKQPIAMVLLPFAFVIVLYWIIKKRYKDALLYGFMGCSVFLSIAVFCTGMFRFLTGNYEYKNNLELQVMKLRSIEDLSLDYGLGRIGNLIVSFIHNVYIMHPAWVIISFFDIIFLIFLGHRRGCFRKIVLNPVFGGGVLSSIIGLGCWFLYDAGGRSEMYFAIASLIPITVVNLVILEQLYGSVTQEKLSINKHIEFMNIAVCIFALGVGINCFMNHAYIGDLLSVVKNSIATVDGSRQESYGFMESETVVAQWVRDNTPKDCTVLSDREYSGGQFVPNSYYYAIFTERQQYLEAADVIQYLVMKPDYHCKVSEERDRRQEIIFKAFSGDYEAIEKLRDEGVDYIIQHEGHTPEFVPYQEILKEVFEYKDFHVFEVL